MSMDESFNKAVSGFRETYDFITENKRVSDAACEKACRLNDGTEVGKLKAEVILLIDERRRLIHGIGFIHAATPENVREEDRAGLQMETTRLTIELQKVERELDVLVKKLDALGVRTKLVRR